MGQHTNQECGMFYRTTDTDFSSSSRVQKKKLGETDLNQGFSTVIPGGLLAMSGNISGCQSWGAATGI